MVTLNKEDKSVLNDLLLGTGSKKWDLVDKSKKNAWMIGTLAALSEDAEAKTAVLKGPITLELLRTADASLSARAAQAKVDELRPTFDTANQRGYRILVPRLDLSRRPAIAERIARNFAEDELGHELWHDVILEESSTSGVSEQKRLKRDLKAFKIDQAVPTGPQLGDALTKMEGIWLLVDGNDPDDPSDLIDRALALATAPTDMREIDIEISI